MSDCGTIDEFESRLNEAWRRLAKRRLQIDVGLSQQAIVRKLDSTNCHDPALHWKEVEAKNSNGRGPTIGNPIEHPYLREASITAPLPVMRLYYDDANSAFCYVVEEKLLMHVRRPDVTSWIPSWLSNP